MWLPADSRRYYALENFWYWPAPALNKGLAIMEICTGALLPQLLALMSSLGRILLRVTDYCIGGDNAGTWLRYIIWHLPILELARKQIASIGSFCCA